MEGISDILASFGRGITLAFEYWWTWLPIILGMAAYKVWFEYQLTKFITGLKWVMLEVIPPPEMLYSSPKAAESIFAGLHATYAGAPGTSWKSQMFQGKVPVWFSFEVVSNGGETHFFIRCQEDQRNVVEALIFSQYPEAEIRVVDDYISVLPPKLSLETYDVAGAELEFTKDSSAYPIKSYMEFEEAGGKDEYARLDPIAPLLEIMSALHAGEHLWLQYVFRATGTDWVKEGQKVVDKLAGREAKDSDSFIGILLSIPAGLLSVIFQVFGLYTPEEEKKKEEKQFNLQSLTPADKLVLEQVQFKLAKLAFKTGIRLVYVAPKDVFDGSRIASVTAMFKQLYYNNLNTFKPGNSTRDKGLLKWIFPNDKGFFTDERIARKKHRIYEAYRGREFPNKAFPKKNGAELLVYLNTEELATLWHLPGLNVRAPLMPRVQSKKGTPPAYLPTRNQ